MVIPHFEDSKIDVADPLLNSIAKYRNYPYMKLIKNSFENASTLSFHYVNQSDIKKEIMNLNNSEAS